MQFTDQLGNVIKLAGTPQRIISLVPSQTELLFDMGVDAEIVGITRYCVHPAEKCKVKPKIGGTKKFKFDVIDQLKPDLIIGNKEENYPEGIRKLQERYPVWMSDVTTLEDALFMIDAIGTLVNRQEIAGKLIEKIRHEMRRLSFPERIPAAYLIWKNPYMAAGGNTFIHEMMTRGGFANIFANLPRYPEVTEAQLHPAEVIFLSSEPFPFQEADVAEFQTRFPGKQVLRVDGTMFSWYGSRLTVAPQYLIELHRKIGSTDVRHSKV